MQPPILGGNAFPSSAGIGHLMGETGVGTIISGDPACGQQACPGLVGPAAEIWSREGQDLWT